MTDVDRIGWDTDGGKYRTDFAHRICGSAIGRAAAWHVDDHPAAGFASPGLGKRNHVGPLTGSEAPSIAADHDFDVLNAFAHDDRMALAIVDRILGYDWRFVAAAQDQREAANG
jgi:hypothetical protein